MVHALALIIGLSMGIFASGMSEQYSSSNTARDMLQLANTGTHEHPHLVCRVTQDAKTGFSTRNGYKVSDACGKAAQDFPHRSVCVKKIPLKPQNVWRKTQFETACECKPACQYSW